MIKTARYLLLFILFTTQQLFSQTVPYDNQLIEKIDVVVVTDPLNKGESIRSRLKSKEGGYFSQTDFDTDLKFLVQDYDRVEPQVESENGKIHISLKIWSKPTIRNIYWEGNCQIEESKLLKELGVKRGTVFDRQGFNTGFHKIKAYYVKKGFFEAELEYNVNLDKETNEVDITICVQEGRAGVIKEICFEGFTAKEESEIAEIMVTKPYSFFLSWLNDQGTYQEEMIQHDKFQVLNYLQNEGYADAVVEFDIKEACQAHRIIITIKADRGNYYTFGPITFEGNEIFCDEQIEDHIEISEGDPFSTDAVHEAIRSLMNYYGRYGYIEAVVNYEPSRTDNPYVYSIHLKITEGEQYRVGMIKVLGNCVTQTKVILHESLIIPGEVFNSEKLKLTERRLQNIGYFKNVNVYAVRAEENALLPPTYRDIHIEVEETSTGNVGAFLGFSTAENLFGGVNLTEKNFNILGFGRIGRDGLCALRGGGEYAHVTATIGQKSRSYVLSWTKPYFMDTKWSFGFTVENSTNEFLSKDYIINSTGFTIHGSYPWNAFVKIGTHYRFHYSDIHIDDDSDLQDLTIDDIDEEGLTAEQRHNLLNSINNERAHKREQIKKQERNSGIISAVGASWLYDSTDNPERATCGFKSKVEGEFAGLGGKTFLSFGYINTYYYDLWGEAVLKLRGNMNFIQPLFSFGPDNIPIDEKFFLGGEYEIRGYRPYRLGPKLANANDDPEGGISMQMISAEIARPLFSRVEGFVFIDGGSLTDDRWHFGKMYFATGFGARLKIMESGPPLTVGIGFPLTHADSSNIKRFFFNIGGKF